MASPNPLNSSPVRKTQREQIHIRSSSPDLPPLQAFISQRLTRSSYQTASEVVPTARSTSAGSNLPHQFGQHFAIDHETDVPITTASRHAQDVFQEEPSVSVIQIPAKPPPKKRKPRAQGTAAKKTTQPRKKAAPPQKREGLVPEQDQVPIIQEQQIDKNQTPKPRATRARNVGKAARMSDHATAVTEVTRPDSLQVDSHGPLNLELAPPRRTDWTPPAQKTVVNLDFDSSALRQLDSPGEGQTISNLKDLLEDYNCSDAEPLTTSFNSENDSSFLKKRKRIELVTVKDDNAPAVANPQKSPRKAVKKKARTITEMATRAYKAPTQPEMNPPSASILNHFQSVSGRSDKSGSEQQPQVKGKTKTSRKKVTKSVKKKTTPPRAILLSPGTALAQVADQDFVFGTSSQLAREESPTVLRDIQAALRQSNQQNDLNYASPINSDAVEPLEQRAKLWEAGARNADGDLFDVDIINLVETSPKHLGDAYDDVDPFGYSANDKRPADKSEFSETSPSRHVLNRLYDTVPLLGAKNKDGGVVSLTLSDSEASPHSNIGKILTQDDNEISQLPHETAHLHEEKAAAQQPPPPKRPDFERYTDARLAKEIKSFGFKAIKRRSAMLALLDQCWQSKMERLGHASIHTSPKQLAPISWKTVSPEQTAAKKPRGRPRKNSIDIPEPQEPPPSAQPPETPMRRRGRPRKDIMSPSVPESRSPEKTPTSVGTASTSKSTRRRKSQSGPVVEIPDSASDIESEIASSPDSTIEKMFSSPPLDMSLATDDTQLSFTASRNDTEEAIFKYITEAVRSAPRTTDPQQPSWHEKILMYEPLVLEDLTAWLNTGELSRVGFDNEVSPADVKKWCELKSICCLWRVNLRGKERKRF